VADRGTRRPHQGGFGDYFNASSPDIPSPWISLKRREHGYLETPTSADHPRTCFSIEPGIYLPEFGVRLEETGLGDNALEVTGAFTP